MGRPQAFDRPAVVRAARGVFWEHGFEGTSVPDLEAATGLSRSSIYNAFGSKRGLFDDVVQSYLDEVIRPRLATLAGPRVAPDAVVDYLDAMRGAVAPPVARVDGGAAPEGCLLLNTAAAPIARDGDIARTIAGYRNELCDALARGVRAHRPDLDSPGCRRLAESLTALVVEALVLVRVSPEEAARLLDVAREVVTVVD